jgi:hypothetical protein
MKTIGGVLIARKLSKLLSDPEFLKFVEEAIFASEKGTERELIQALERLRPYTLQVMETSLSD